MLLIAKCKCGFLKTFWGIVLVLCGRYVSGDMVYKYIRSKHWAVKKFVPDIASCLRRQLNKTQEKEKERYIKRYIKRKYLNRDIIQGLHKY